LEIEHSLQTANELVRSAQRLNEALKPVNDMAEQVKSLKRQLDVLELLVKQHCKE
jgi:hypothetical protein